MSRHREGQPAKWGGKCGGRCPGRPRFKDKNHAHWIWLPANGDLHVFSPCRLPAHLKHIKLISCENNILELVDRTYPVYNAPLDSSPLERRLPPFIRLNDCLVILLSRPPHMLRFMNRQSHWHQCVFEALHAADTTARWILIQCDSVTQIPLSLTTIEHVVTYESC